VAEQIPKILTQLTIVAGVNDKIAWTTTTDGAGTTTLDAGDYYLSWDGRLSTSTGDDDLCKEIENQLQGDITYGVKVMIGDDDDVPFTGLKRGKVRIHFVGTNAHTIDLKWATDSTTEALAKILGFDERATDQETIAAGVADFDADYQHAYGWYPVAADNEWTVMSIGHDPAMHRETYDADIAGDGSPWGMSFGSSRMHRTVLRFMSEAEVWSNNQAYTEIPAYPLDITSMNRALECWHLATRDGTPFRLYPDSMGAAVESDTADAHADTTDTKIARAAASWKRDEYVDLMVLITDGDAQYSRAPIYSVHDEASPPYIFSLERFENYNGGGLDVDGATYSVYDRQYITMRRAAETIDFDPTRPIEHLPLYQVVFEGIVVP